MYEYVQHLFLYKTEIESTSCVAATLARSQQRLFIVRKQTHFSSISPKKMQEKRSGYTIYDKPQCGLTLCYDPIALRLLELSFCTDFRLHLFVQCPLLWHSPDLSLFLLKNGLLLGREIIE